MIDMQTVRIVAPDLLDEDALRMTRELVDAGFSADAHGPDPARDGSETTADLAEQERAREMSAPDRLAWYQSEQIRRELEGDEGHTRGWVILATLEA